MRYAMSMTEYSSVHYAIDVTLVITKCLEVLVDFDMLLASLESLVDAETRLGIVGDPCQVKTTLRSGAKESVLRCLRKRC